MSVLWQADTLQRRMFYVPSFKIYGAVAGFYDYGPPGCAVKQNLTALWRKHFVLEENMLEVRAWPACRACASQPGRLKATPARSLHAWCQ